MDSTVQKKASNAKLHPEGADMPPPLQRALECLPVSLDEELARYRRARHGADGIAASSRSNFRLRRPGLNLIRVKPQAAATHSASSSEALTVADSSTPEAAERSIGLTSLSQALSNPNVSQFGAQAETALAKGPTTNESINPEASKVTGPQGGQLAPYEPIPDSYLETTEALLQSGSVSYSRGEPEYAPTWRDYLSTPLGLGGLLLLLIGSSGLGYFVTNPRAAQHLWRHPALQGLRPQPPEPAINSDPKISPPASPIDGLGPDLSQREFTELTLSTLSALSSEDIGVMASPSPPDSQTTSYSTVQPGLGSLSSGESPPVQLSSRPTGYPSPQPAPGRAAPSPASSQAGGSSLAVQPVSPQSEGAHSAPTVVRPTAQPQAAIPQTPPQTPSQAPSEAAALPTTGPSATQNSAQNSTAAAVGASTNIAAAPRVSPNFYVVADFTGDASLDAVQTVVGDAYLRNFPMGARIQMGAFEHRSSALTLIRQLEGHGISAELYEAE